MTHLDDCWAFTLSKEGAYQRNRSDRGNWSSGRVGVGVLVGTNMGISAPVLAHWRGGPVTAQDMQNLQPAEAHTIAGALFGNPLLIEQIPPGPDLMTFDMAFNSGLSFGARTLQSAAGAGVDGFVGPLTIAAVQATAPADLVARLDLAGRQHYMNDPDFPEFGAGWMQRAADRLAAANARLATPG